MDYLHQHQLVVQVVAQIQVGAQERELVQVADQLLAQQLTQPIKQY